MTNRCTGYIYRRRQRVLHEWEEKTYTVSRNEDYKRQIWRCLLLLRHGYTARSLHRCVTGYNSSHMYSLVAKGNSFPYSVSEISVKCTHCSTRENTNREHTLIFASQHPAPWCDLTSHFYSIYSWPWRRVDEDGRGKLKYRSQRLYLRGSTTQK